MSVMGNTNDRPRVHQHCRVLVLPVKGEFFSQMKARTKLFEYRLRTPFWRKRLVGREYEEVCVTLGYPARSDTERRLLVPWQGYEEQTLQHPFFGPEPVDVFAIRIWPANVR
ncbi:ASCH domain-containing protein [Paraburkholderia sp. EG287A]|uniref:ASCH domain-containing protein n=1 Tax=Paraburkholderia sp. EG287A TaxID=3237012 RepID=UPI0034D193A2